MTLIVRSLCVALLIVFANARGSWAAETPRPLVVVTTIAQVADVTRRIAGSLAEVTSLMGEGVDPHTYRQTRSDIVALRRADLILYNGLYLEAQLEKLLLELSRHQPVVAVGERIDRSRLLAHTSYPGKLDPHIWMDVMLWAEVVDAIADALVERDPEHAAVYRANAVPVRRDLESLDAYVRATIAAIPLEHRVLVTAHDAFRYFARAYGIEVMGIQGLSTESEAGLKRIEDLVDMLVTRQVAAVFVESSVADRNVQALIEGAAARGAKVTIGGRLFSDAMGAPGTYEGTYLGMLDHNATVIGKALGVDTPKHGWRGLLAAGS